MREILLSKVLAPAYLFACGPEGLSGAQISEIVFSSHDEQRNFKNSDLVNMTCHVTNSYLRLLTATSA